MATAIVIGGGINGLSSAYYLRQTGWDVTVLDKNDFTDNCSHGNMGYICPSHFVPLASPGIISQGLRWMLNPESPFYIKPRLDINLMRWGIHFVRSATTAHLERSAEPLRDIALLSKKLYEEWITLPGFEVAYQRRGLLEVFQTASKEQYAHHTVDDAAKLGLEARMLTAAEVQEMEPHTKMNVKGGLLFNGDAHLEPNKVMVAMRQWLAGHGVKMEGGQEVTGFEKEKSTITSVQTATSRYEADMVVIAGGAWSRQLAQLAGAKIPLVGGRGYSFTLKDSGFQIEHPIVLMEGRVALTPFSATSLRIGGTMEITNLDAPPNYNRVKGIIKATLQYFPEASFGEPSAADIWYGYRPCSADGLPYIGRTARFNNCIIATGHAMIGMSLGAATGKLVSEIANEQPLSCGIAPYNVHRFD